MKKEIKPGHDRKGITQARLALVNELRHALEKVVFLSVPELKVTTFDGTHIGSNGTPSLLLEWEDHEMWIVPWPSGPGDYRPDFTLGCKLLSGNVLGHLSYENPVDWKTAARLLDCAQTILAKAPLVEVR